MKNEMIDFLERLPWASQALLEGYFGTEKAEELLQQCSNEIVSFRFPDEQLHYTVKPADYHLLPGIYRREMVRNYMAEKFGYSIFDTAESPSFNADFRTFYEEQNLWIRVWGDMGHISVESLLIFRNPPAFASDIHDIILTCQGWERTAFLKIQAELNWNDAKNGNVEIIDYISGHRVICTGFKSKENHKPYDPEKDSCQSLSPSEISVYNDTGKREISIQKLRSTEICLKSAMLSQGDYDLLRFIACNPFLKRPEIQLLFGSDDCDADSYELTEAEHDRIKMLQGDIDRLKDNGFLRIIPSGPMDDTYLLTWKGLDLVAAYHATIPFYLKKYPHSSKDPEQQHIDCCPGKDAQEGVVLPLEAECDDEHCDGRGNACSDDIRLYTLKAIDDQHRHDGRGQRGPEAREPVRHLPITGKQQKRKGSKRKGNKRRDENGQNDIEVHDFSTSFALRPLS